MITAKLLECTYKDHAGDIMVPISEFPNSKHCEHRDYKYNYCKACCKKIAIQKREYKKKYYQEHKEEQKERNQKHIKKYCIKTDGDITYFFTVFFKDGVWLAIKEGKNFYSTKTLDKLYRGQYILKGVYEGALRLEAKDFLSSSLEKSNRYWFKYDEETERKLVSFLSKYSDKKIG